MLTWVKMVLWGKKQAGVVVTKQQRGLLQIRCCCTVVVAAAVAAAVVKYVNILCLILQIKCTSDVFGNLTC